MHRHVLPWVLALSYLMMAACGGGNTQSGQFSDLTVRGLDYSSSAMTDKTNDTGEFRYVEGDRVAFSIGGLALFEVLPQSEITVAESTFLVDESHRFRFFNVLILLYSLDMDADPSNGISIGTLASELVANYNINLDQVPTEFVEDAQTLGFVQSVTSLTALVSPQLALEYYEQFFLGGSFSAIRHQNLVVLDAILDSRGAAPEIRGTTSSTMGASMRISAHHEHPFRAKLNTYFGAT